MITTREIYGKFKNTLHREICKHKKQFFYSWKKLFAHSSFNDFFYQQFEFHGEIKSKNLIFLVSCSEIGHLHIFLGTKKVPRKFKKRSLFSENWKIRNDCICISEVAVVRLNIGSSISDRVAYSCTLKREYVIKSFWEDVIYGHPRSRNVNWNRYKLLNLHTHFFLISSPVHSA